MANPPRMQKMGLKTMIRHPDTTHSFAQSGDFDISGFGVEMAPHGVILTGREREVTVPWPQVAYIEREVVKQKGR